MASFLSTYVNKVDKKGRVSVPAPYRAELKGEPFQGLIVFRSIHIDGLEAFGRSTLDELISRRQAQHMESGDFEKTLLGAPVEDPVETILGMVRPLPFDGEGRITLTPELMAIAGITDYASFVGRGSRIQIWAPDRFEAHEAQAVERLRAQLGGDPS